MCLPFTCTDGKRQRMRTGWLAAGLIMISMLTATRPAQAQIETLIMPGPVADAHADYETECESCHVRFDRGRQRDLCLDCHEEIAADISARDGFHGRFDDAQSGSCAGCHTDHKGRDADIVGLVESTFDHDLTDFPLVGKHSSGRCGDCHASDARHREAPSDCYSCHEAENPHGDTLGTSCGDCHTPVDWLDVEFDHDTTGYPLIGKHQGPACLDCHADDAFQNTPTDCYSCHAKDDAHDGRSGDECGNCHNPRGWDDTSFDHDRDTRFALDGEHAQLSCSDCHSDDPFSDELEPECISCHADDDNHDGHFGDRCETCHATAAWPEIHFDHRIDTGHALEGAHADAQCTACHIEPIYDVALRTDCLACHEDDDAHEKSLGIRCNDCHNESTWQDDVFFDHDLTRFPLLGEHAEVECDACHESHVFRDAPGDCVDCHRSDDAHDGRFGEACALCHNPVDWAQWQFDHDTQTNFALDGAHDEVACEACHRRPLGAQSKLGQFCADCHLSDDIHDGEFGRDCARCHTADSFREVRSIR